MVRDANTLAFKAGYNFGETAELFESSYQVKPADLAPGMYTNISGNTALAWGLVAAGQLGATTSSGPGVALKSDPIRLPISLELPLLIIDTQRGGPSPGLPTKTE